MSKSRDSRTVEPLITCLRDDNPWVRARAAGALGRTGDSRAEEPLILALKDDDPWVRGEAAWALGEIGSPVAGIEGS